MRPTWCPASAVEHIDAAGLLSVKLFGAVGDGLHDDAPAVRTALNVSAGCGGCVFFPPETMMTLSLLFLLTAFAHSPSVAPFSPRWGAAASTGASAAWQAKAGAVLGTSRPQQPPRT